MSTPFERKDGLESDQMDPSGSEIMTPFKGRAWEENRIRQALRMSVTPGLKRRLQLQKSHSSWRSNPSELRSFINDMSESRYQNSSGRNLMGQLNQVAKEDAEVMSSSLPIESLPVEIEQVVPGDNGENNTGPKLSITEELASEQYEQRNFQEMEEKGDMEEKKETHIEEVKPTKRLSDLIFSQLKIPQREVKIRKLEPLEIKDVGLKPLVESQNNHTTDYEYNKDNTGLPPSFLNGDNNSNIISNLGAGLPHTPPTVKPIYTENLPLQGTASMNFDNDSMDMDMDIQMVSPGVRRHDEVPSFAMDNEIPSVEHIDGIPGISENIDINTKIRQFLIRSDGSFEKDFDKIITFLTSNNLIIDDSMPSMNDIYEICCQYLDMSEMNSIERIWFG